MSGHVVVAGGASGIGLATARLLADSGFQVSVLDASRDSLAGADAELRGGDALLLEADITDEDAVEEALDEAEETFGPPVGLVNSAGFARDLSFEATDAEGFREALEINLTGSFITAKAVVLRMVDGGAVVNVSSVSGLRGFPGRIADAAAKGGLIAMTQAMAAELGPKGIRVNAVAAGAIDTPHVHHLHDAEMRRLWRDHIPQRRYGEPAEVASAVLFLLSEAGGYINGHILCVDGGFLAAGILRPD
ncbi:NAD(P)-dependent dehydrogenase (short-subunit alcohol dehydrogenase family) [Rhodopseudomonas julia]|uniref:NAD(P)-dependent dehydrogenase (Short-subunit alcohol dehydrogenase family) n=1 Tax=Rhodopseudomonas julia TaxID=200617 RepID=A0ABU0C2A3_9BRAD|nr:SDR family oxidoreductase [Rhodopseudomonas julia]MDQ0324634.1 NAD(P)-dependent dehydrogenase (short-subunit alcohol dehydrogenase family) [Rhodopseudomonas julia]